MTDTDFGKVYDQQVADTYDRDEYGLLRGVRSLALAQVAASDLPAASVVLDLGAGTGESLVALQQRFAGGRFIGIDLSARMLEIASRKVPLEAHVDDACNAGVYVGDGSVDVVLAHFLTSFVDRRHLFTVARRAVRNGGLISVASTTHEALPRLRAGITAVLGDAAAVEAAVPSPRNAEEITAELRRCGFDVTSVETFRRSLTFQTFDECLQWGLESGFLAQAVEVLGMDRVDALRPMAAALFPLHDEYAGVAVAARAASRG